MSSPPADRRDFFVSFNSADRDWAEWIANELEAAGYTTFFQHWDFAPGSNFVLEMHKAASLSDRTIAVLSPDYLKALFTQPEWAAALVQDPTGAKRILIPVRVHQCTPEGILAPIVYADLTGLDEATARTRLLSAAQGGRPKPQTVAFPGAPKRKFPGGGSPSTEIRPRPTTNTTVKAPANMSPRQPRSIPGRTWLPFVWFGLALLLAIAIVAGGEKVTVFRLVNQIYYVILVALGLAAAGSLFIGVHSIAKYRGTNSWGTLELGGPAVIFVLVVGGGAYFAPDKPTFALTVFVHGPAGPQDVVLRSQGKVAIDLGPDRRVESIGEKGAASFAGIPSEFRGQKIPVSLDADGFERAEAGPLSLAGESLYVAVRKRAGRLNGLVVDETGDPVANATADVGGVTAPTNAQGRFELLIPSDRVREEMTLDVRAAGFVSQTHTVVPGGNEIRIRMVRRAP